MEINTLVWINFGAFKGEEGVVIGEEDGMVTVEVKMRDGSRPKVALLEDWITEPFDKLFKEGVSVLIRDGHWTTGDFNGMIGTIKGLSIPNSSIYDVEVHIAAEHKDVMIQCFAAWLKPIDLSDDVETSGLFISTEDPGENATKSTLVEDLRPISEVLEDLLASTESANDLKSDNRKNPIQNEVPVRDNIELDLMPYKGFPFMHQMIQDILDISHDEPLTVGDVFVTRQFLEGQDSPTVKKYIVREVVDTRPSRGNWKPLEFIPTWHRLKIELTHSFVG